MGNNVLRFKDILMGGLVTASGVMSFLGGDVFSGGLLAAAGAVYLFSYWKNNDESWV